MSISTVTTIIEFHIICINYLDMSNVVFPLTIVQGGTVLIMLSGSRVLCLEENGMFGWHHQLNGHEFE